MEFENENKPWTDEEIKNLRSLIDKQCITKVISLILKRSPEAIYDMCKILDISAKPKDPNS